MHPAARIFLGFFALWTLLKTPVFFTRAQQTRRHRKEAPPEIRRPLRNRMIGDYGLSFMNIVIFVITGSVAILGSTSFITEWKWLMVAIFAPGFVAAPFGIKAAFDSLHNPAMEGFDRRFGLASIRLFRRGRSREGPTVGG